MVKVSSPFHPGVVRGGDAHRLHGVVRLQTPPCRWRPGRCPGRRSRRPASPDCRRWPSASSAPSPASIEAALRLTSNSTAVPSAAVADVSIDTSAASSSVMVPVPASDVSLMSTPPGSGLPPMVVLLQCHREGFIDPSTRSSFTVAKLTVFEAVSVGANTTVPVTGWSSVRSDPSPDERRRPDAARRRRRPAHRHRMLRRRTQIDGERHRRAFRRRRRRRDRHLCRLGLR